MAAKVFEKSAEETAFRAVLKEVYESGKNSVAVLWADAALSARFQETLYAFLLKDVLGSAAAGVKLRALCAFCGGEAETAAEYGAEPAFPAFGRAFASVFGGTAHAVSNPISKTSKITTVLFIANSPFLIVPESLILKPSDSTPLFN